ncbi:MAG: ABC transporter ATP-binding protein [bacterium]
MVQAINLKKSFKSGLGKKFAVDDISFEFPNTGLFMIFGKSGSGKTTFLNLLSGMEYPSSGKVLIEGKELGKDIDNIRNSKMGFIFQNYYLEKGFTVEEIIENGLIISGQGKDKNLDDRVNTALELVGMTRYRKKNGDALSGGQKQRVAVARALVKETNIIFADEPTGNLDSENTHNLMKILKNIAKDKLVIMVTHEVNLIEDYADDYIEIKDGKILDERNVVLKNSVSNIKKEVDEKEKVIGKTGRLFNKRTIKKIGLQKENSSFANALKQIYNSILSLCFILLLFSLFLFSSTEYLKKDIDDSNIYLNLNSYKTLRSLEEKYYDEIDFFETEFKVGNFNSLAYVSLPSIEISYEANSIDENLTNDDLILGVLPNSSEVLISEDIANELLANIQINELATLEHVLNMSLNSKYTICGITKSKNKSIQFTREDYVNFLNVYSVLKLNDFQNIFLSDSFTDVSFSTEIRLTSKELDTDMVEVEINRNSLYKMMSNVNEADLLVESANTKLTKQSKAIQITDSKMYVKSFSITRNIMSTDFIIYVNENALDNIFTYISPNIESLEGDGLNDLIEKNYFFKVTPNADVALVELREVLILGGCEFVDINQIYQTQEKLLKNESVSFIKYALVVLTLTLSIYYFMEKSLSIKNAKEYGVYRAIGVSKINLLNKEVSSTFKGNIVNFIISFIVMAILVSIWIVLSSMNVWIFILFAILLLIISSILLIIISLIPYIFVFYQSPANILSKYDI